MKFKYGLKELKIAFEYPHKHSKKRQIVRCALLEKGNVIPFNTGESNVNLKAGDVFDKEVGRRVSLQRALMGLPRETRKKAWESYWDRLPKEKGRVVIPAVPPMVN